MDLAVQSPVASLLSLTKYAEPCNLDKNVRILDLFHDLKGFPQMQLE